MDKKMVNITIDDKHVQVPAGTTIHMAAKEVGINIPTLCYLNLNDFGCVSKVASCRVCVVEVTGKATLLRHVPLLYLKEWKSVLIL